MALFVVEIMIVLHNMVVCVLWMPADFKDNDFYRSTATFICTVIMLLCKRENLQNRYILISELIDQLFKRGQKI